jgi:bifunctional UDP-N-acetylglucosamine pyrophosphorylase/glucosamine-1-phosphate N-acetyltransferase
MTKDTAAVVLCAGKGTRMKSSRAKVLHEIMGRPLGYYPLRCALQVGANPVVAVIGHQAEEVQRTMESAFADHTLRFASQ